MIQLGISAFYHDSAACIVQDGKVLAAAEEERFTEIKHDSSFPVNAIAYVLSEAGIEDIKLSKIDLFFFITTILILLKIYLNVILGIKV